MSILLLPLHGAFLIIHFLALALIVAGLVSVFAHRSDAFTAAGKLPKVFWIAVLLIGVFITFVGIIGGLVYFLDVRPALRTVSGGGGTRGGGGSSSDGPYGPFRG